ncbi:MAG: DUF711 family protein [Anaerolineales bacterium]|nr:DUF711 family protein [Anaerolineales bacterium]
MNIRSVTYFDNPHHPIDEAVLDRAGECTNQAISAFEDAGYEVQTARFATPPFPRFLPGLEEDMVLSYAQSLESGLTQRGFDYLSLGPALPSHPHSYPLIPRILRETENVFLSGSLTDPERGISLAAVKACGEIIHTLAPLDPNGFANLYFAALGNVPPGAPFFPAAYHHPGPPGFALAIECADLALDAFQNAESFQGARRKLIRDLESHSEALTARSANIEKTFGVRFQGIDYSPAPFPEESRSLGAALESLGIKALGNHGSLAAAAFLTDSIDRAKFPRTGFSGLMAPVLEDMILAARAGEGSLTVKDLLLYSAVCGTGLDTLPLPGDLTGKEISAVLLDIAALSLRLDKPLTARLMPIPGKKAGDATNFDFPYFANSKVMALEARKLDGLMDGDGYLDIQPRNR